MSDDEHLFTLFIVVILKQSFLFTYYIAFELLLDNVKEIKESYT